MQGNVASQMATSTATPAESARVRGVSGRRRHAGRTIIMGVALLWMCAFLVALERVEALEMGAFASDSHRQLGRVDPDQVVPLAIALKPRDFRALEDMLYRVSDPRNAEYGKHFTKQAADDLARPDERALAALHEWVKPFADAEQTQARFSATANTLRVSMRARQLEAMLDTQLHEYETVEETEGSRRRRCLVRAATSVAIPANLAGAIAFVSVNTNPFKLRSLAASAPSSPQAIGGGTLETIRRLYGIPDNLVVTNATNTQSVPSFYHESWSQADLEVFYNKFLAGEPLPRIVAKGKRQNDPSRASIEASLDVEYITGVARNTTTYVWTMNGSNPFSVQDEPFVAFAEAVLELETPPYVVSISYSDDEEHIFNTCADYARSFDTLLIKMGLRGITVLIASGDDGVAGLRPEFNNIPRDKACDQHGPQWPSASPYVTSVGATMLLGSQQPDKNFFRTDEEVVCSGEAGGMITSGGGFSSVYPMPEYQRSAVERYLKSKRIPTRAGFFNSSGRAYPDISALGAGFMVQLNKRMTTVSGTSASTPVVGAMVTLWNDIRLNAGKSPLGFINPLIYYLAEHEPAAFNDIVVGNNGASKGSSNTCQDSFGAAGGWDAVTGVGSPNFGIVADFIRGLEDKFNLSAPASAVAPDCVIKGSVPSEAQAAKDTISSKTVGIALLAASVLVAAIVGAVVAVKVYTHWRRTQYASLNSETTSSSARDESSNVTPPGSPTSSPRGSIVRQGDDDFDPEKLENGGVEMSEINLRD